MNIFYLNPKIMDSLKYTEVKKKTYIWGLSWSSKVDVDERRKKKKENRNGKNIREAIK